MTQASDSIRFSIRRALVEDAPALADLYNSQEAESGPRDADSFRRDLEHTGDTGREDRLVALQGEQVIGYAAANPAWWTGSDDVYALDIRVARPFWGSGTGTALYAALCLAPGAGNANRMLAWIRNDLPEARRFAARHGFTHTGQVLEESRLYLPEARVETVTSAADPLHAAGIRIRTLAEIAPDESFLRQLQRLWDDENGSNSIAFETWRSSVLEGDGLSPDTHWVALDGRRPIGTTFLNVLGPHGAENDYTAVAPSHRGRGIAPALKARAIAWGQEHGMTWFYTSSLIENAPMRSINHRLGYRPGARKSEVARDLEAAP